MARWGAWYGKGAQRVVVLAGLLWACQSAPVVPPDLGPYRAPGELSGTVQSFQGSILGGAQIVAEPRATGGAEAMDWGVELMFVQRFPEPGLESLAPRLRMIAHPGQSSPIQGAPLLAVGAQFAAGDGVQVAWEALQGGSGGRIGSWFVQEGQLAAGHTTQLEWQLTEVVPDPDNFLREWPARQPIDKRFAVALESGPDALQLGFLLEDLGRPRNEERQEEAPREGGRPDGPRMQREWVLPAVQLSEAAQAALFLLPNPFETVEAEVLAIRLWAGPTATPDPTTMVESTEGETGVAEEADSHQPRELSPPLATLAKLQTQIQNAKEAETPIAVDELRGPLLYLASQTRGTLTKDLVLTGTVEQLRGWLEFVPEADQLEDANWTWAMERAAWVSLARLQVKDQLPREYRALLLRSAGEVGQYPSTIEAAALQSADEATFGERLVAENLLFLDDSNPGARVRAFDWLALRDVEVTGFDPLGTKKERRAALRAWEAAQEEEETQR